LCRRIHARRRYSGNSYNGAADGFVNAEGAVIVGDGKSGRALCGCAPTVVNTLENLDLAICACWLIGAPMVLRREDTHGSRCGACPAVLLRHDEARAAELRQEFEAWKFSQCDMIFDRTLRASGDVLVARRKLFQSKCHFATRSG
jgi:hypothetical protein